MQIVYETMYILRPDLGDEQVEQVNDGERQRAGRRSLPPVGESTLAATGCGAADRRPV